MNLSLTDGSEIRHPLSDRFQTLAFSFHTMAHSFMAPNVRQDGSTPVWVAATNLTGKGLWWSILQSQHASQIDARFLF